MKLINFGGKKDTEFEDLLTKISSFNGALEGSDIPQLFANVEKIFEEKRIKEIYTSFQENPLEIVREGLKRYERAKKLSEMMKEQSSRILEIYFGNKCSIDEILSDEETISKLVQLGLLVFACGIELHETGTSGCGYLYRLMGKDYEKSHIIPRLIDYTERRGCTKENQKLEEALTILKKIYLQVHDFQNPTNYWSLASELRTGACKTFKLFYERNLLSYEKFSQLKEVFDRGRLKDDDMAWVKYPRYVEVTSIVQ